MIKSISIRNLLSFGPDTPVLELRALNVLIGPNGAGKSNFIEVLGLLKAATEPRGLFWPMKSAGGVAEWIRGEAKIVADVATMVTTVINGEGDEGPEMTVITHQLAFKAEREPCFTRESVSLTGRSSQYEYPCLGRPTLDAVVAKIINDDIFREEEMDHPSSTQSILGQRKRPRNHACDGLEEAYSQIQIYNNWSFGRKAPAREDQKSDLPSDFLSPECDNLAMVLSDLILQPAVKDAILKALNALMPDVIDLQIRPSGGRLQVYLREGDRMTSAVRLSDGTLRFLCLLAILCNPKPPAIVCLEEPELGMHPDVIPTIAELLREAATHSQLIVTTHSPMLLECFSETPEDILVVERPGADTVMRRLDAGELAPWLREYSLGQLWSRGDLGGNRY